uniref:Uncharacterized protein n=1 Tax=Plectus sambesii TaxID=2011161 RepID=A0A914UTE6_9BILA
MIDYSFASYDNSPNNGSVYCSAGDTTSGNSDYYRSKFKAAANVSRRSTSRSCCTRCSTGRRSTCCSSSRSTKNTACRTVETDLKRRPAGFKVANKECLIKALPVGSSAQATATVS